ncbi:MAG: hypothetical protein ACRD1A_01895 [Terriglobales bacterium]
MKTLLTRLAPLVIVPALAGGCLALSQQTPKAQVFVGGQAVHAGGVTEGGFIGSATLDVAPVVGLTVQASVIPGFGGTGFAILAGPTIYPVGHKRVSPFIQALGGGAFASSSGGVSAAVFAASVGGGIDAAVSDRIAIKVGADWLHVPAFGASAARAYVGVAFSF